MSLRLSVRRPTAEQIEAFRREQSQLGFTYDDVGATRTGATPAGFHIDHWSAPLGLGDAAFARAKDGLRGWVAHRGAGVVITPANAPLTEDQTVALLVRGGPAFMLFACRVVWTVDTADEFGFAYGTLPGHPESGEESFVIRRDGDAVRFDVDAIARPLHPLAKLGGPVARWMQVQTSRRYLKAMQAYVAAAP
jgi:uncharacterized protein (UPF0548 family)